MRSGCLVAVFPRAYARPWDVDQPAVREVAAVASVGGGAALSHLSALRRWGLPALAGPGGTGADGQVHVIVGAARHPRGCDGLVVHRTRRPVPVLERGGVATQRLDDAAVACWPLLPPAARRAPLILAVQQRMTTPQRLATAAQRAGTAPGSNSLRELIGLLAAGCRSELELWGHLSVFDVPGLRDAVRQRPVRIGARTFYLDLAYEAERVAVELDGRAYHSGPQQWERDIRRDLALATAGWQTVRLSHARLTTDVAGVRRDVLAVRAARADDATGAGGVNALRADTPG